MRYNANSSFAQSALVQTSNSMHKLSSFLRILSKFSFGVNFGVSIKNSARWRLLFSKRKLNRCAHILGQDGDFRSYKDNLSNVIFKCHCNEKIIHYVLIVTEQHQASSVFSVSRYFVLFPRYLGF